MKKLFLLLGLSLLALPMLAQEIDESYVFMDEEGEILENGATVIRNTVSADALGNDVIYSGIWVLNMAGSSADYLDVHYNVQQIDNGTYQICFPSSCNMQTTVGEYHTGYGQLSNDLQDIQSEWFPTADGECLVTLTIEILAKTGSFPNISYDHVAWGPSLTIRFVKGDLPQPGKSGDVNGDGEVNIADVNAVIDMILSGNSATSGDVNNDGEVNIADVNAVIDMILNPA